MIVPIVRTAIVSLRRDRAALALSFILPIVFFSIFAVIFGGQHDSTAKIHVILVDEDVDLFDSDDVLWAMQTRFQGEMDTTFLSGVTGHVLDPSQSPLYDPRLPDKGTTCKTIFDCTVPFHLKAHFVRAQFKDVDPSLWAPSLFGKPAS